MNGKRSKLGMICHLAKYILAHGDETDIARAAYRFELLEQGRETTCDVMFALSDIIQDPEFGCDA